MKLAAVVAGICRQPCVAFVRLVRGDVALPGAFRYRCGLGVDPEVASMILRHSDSAVTRRHYIKLQSHKEGAADMSRLEKSLAGRGKLSGKKKGPK